MGAFRNRARVQVVCTHKDHGPNGHKYERETDSRRANDPQNPDFACAEHQNQLLTLKAVIVISSTENED